MNKLIKTFAQFKDFIGAILTEKGWVRGANDPDKARDDDIFWFVACKRAVETDEMNRREIAEMLLRGVPAVDVDNVEGWLDQFYSDIYAFGDDAPKIEAYIDITNELLRAEVLDHFGLNEEGDLAAAYDKWQSQLDELSH